MFGIDERALRVVWTVFLFALLLAIVREIRSTLLLFSAAIFFAYMLSPIVAVIERFLPKRRSLALTIVYVALIGVLALLGFELIPTFAGEATSLFQTLPSRITGGSLTRIPLPHALEPLREQVIGILSEGANNLKTSAVPFLQRAGSEILSGLGAILPAILVPILAFFFLKDARAIRSFLLGAMEDGHDRSTVALILNDVHQVLRNYIRALVLLAIASFLAWVVFLNLMHFPYELLLAGIAGILEFIPVIGPATALVIMLIVFIVTNAGGLVWVLVFWACFRIFQDYVLSPYLMSSGIELHPLLILFGVLAGEQIGGVAGMFFSIPVIAILKVIVNHLRDSYNRHQMSAGTSAPRVLTEPVDYRSSRPPQTVA